MFCLGRFELSPVALSAFTFPRHTVFQEASSVTAGRVAHTVVRGNCLFKVVDQKTCQYSLRSQKAMSSGNLNLSSHILG